jgi:hypothetical protein
VFFGSHVTIEYLYDFVHARVVADGEDGKVDALKYVYFGVPESPEESKVACEHVGFKWS